MKQVIVFTILTFILGPWGEAQAQDAEYRITDTHGPAAILPQGKKKASPVVKNLKLREGDRLLTGKNGRVEISNNRGSVIELKEYSNFKVETLKGRVKVFFLKAGRLLGSFKAKKRKQKYKFKTPVSVASVRGTELALVCEEGTELQAGVIEGDVYFGPPEDASEEVLALWKDKDLLVGESEGIIIKEKEPPVPTLEIPPLVVSSLDWFENVKDRIPKIKDQWKEFSAPAQLKLRNKALKESIKWEIPDKVLLDEPVKKKGLDVPKVKLEKYKVPGLK